MATMVAGIITNERGEVQHKLPRYDYTNDNGRFWDFDNHLGQEGWRKQRYINYSYKDTYSIMIFEWNGRNGGYWEQIDNFSIKKR